MGSAIPFGRAGEGTVVKGTLESRDIRLRRMASLSRHSFYMMRQRLLLHKDLVAPFALNLPIGIVLVHMHAHS